MAPAPGTPLGMPFVSRWQAGAQHTIHSTRKHPSFPDVMQHLMHAAQYQGCGLVGIIIFRQEQHVIIDSQYQVSRWVQ